MNEAWRGKRVAVAVSGGLDSLCALLFLKEAGCDVFALHGRMLGGACGQIADMRQLCASLGVELHVEDLRALFAERVVEPFAEACLKGLTPNPCALCNREIKFGALRRKAMELGAELFATGHYASLAKSPYGALCLAPAADPQKDQAYFLSLLPKEALASLLFPLAGMKKEACRRKLAAKGIQPPCPGESQDVCFLPKGGRCADFVADWAAARGIPPGAPGPVWILARGADGRARKLPGGSHKGLFRHTIGQRRGLGVPWREPLHVLAKDAAANSLLLAPRSELRLKGCKAGAVNFFVQPESWPPRLFARLRHRQKAAEVDADPRDGKLILRFKEALFPSAEGQVATVEDEAGLILAAGLIEEMFFEDGAGPLP